MDTIVIAAAELAEMSSADAIAVLGWVPKQEAGTVAGPNRRNRRRVQATTDAVVFGAPELAALDTETILAAFGR